MGMLFQIALNNALAAALLAPFAWCVSRARRPELTVAVWLLVLLKLVTPPIWTLHIPLNGHSHAGAHLASNAPISTQQKIVPPNAIPLPRDEFGSQNLVEQTNADLGSKFKTPSTTASTNWSADIRMVLTVLWIAGSAICLLKLLVAFVRLRRLARASQPANCELLHRIRQLASLFGLRSAPPLRVVDLPIPPMLCAVGFRPYVILPASLWKQLSMPEQDAVLAHELAHLARRDHWLRAFELLVYSLYWWHPAVWWARRELREATEQCCDALALRTIPDCADSYAGALLEAIDFISTARTAEPALACGMGQFTNLQRRLVMITQQSTRHSLTRPAFAALVAVAAIVLPLSTTFAQVEKPEVSIDNPRVPETRLDKPRGADRLDPPSTNGHAIRLYRLRHVNAATAARALEVVFPKSGFDPFDKQQTEAKASVVTDPRTNSVLITGTPAALAVATKLLEVLDDTAAAGDRVVEVAPGSTVRGQPAPGDLLAEPVRADRGRRSVDRAAMEERLERLESQASEILNQIHQIKQEMGAGQTLRTH